jgi:DNA repair exonuclease SbcCD ATPase subunit
MRSTVCMRRFLVVLGVSLVGCAGRPMEPPAPPPLPPIPANAPFFAPAPQDGKLRQSLRQKTEQLLASCPVVYPCDRAHLLRGLAALYEDRELAAIHFRAAAVSAPNSSAGASSLAWLQLLKENDLPVAPASLGQATERLIQDLIEQELGRRQEPHEPTGAAEIATLKQELKVRDKQLEQELKARDKQLDELNKQLEALKQIDREMRDKTQQTRPPTKPTPPKPSEGP